MKSALVFTRTKHRANRLADWLERQGVRAARIHGNRSQSQRTQALEGFKAGPLRRARGDRHRGARHRRGGARPRRELRRAGGERGLHPPRRPHRPRRADGRGVHLRRARRTSRTCARSSARSASRCRACCCPTSTTSRSRPRGAGAQATAPAPARAAARTAPAPRPGHGRRPPARREQRHAPGAASPRAPGPAGSSPTRAAARPRRAAARPAASGRAAAASSRRWTSGPGRAGPRARVRRDARASCAWRDASPGARPFSWSASRHDTFASCRRRYYYSYYASLEDPEIHRLKKLSALPLWAGSVVHDTIETFLKSARRACPRRRSRRRSSARSSTPGCWPTGARARRAPLRFRLFEHEYEIPVEQEDKRIAVNIVMRSLKHFFKSETLRAAFEVGRERWLALEDLVSFHVGDVEVFLRMDLAYPRPRRPGRDRGLEDGPRARAASTRCRWPATRSTPPRRAGWASPRRSRPSSATS